MEAPQPLLSIIVPVYNEAATVATLLGRVLVEVALAKEIIVVNDGSTDGTAAALQSFASTPGMRVLHHAKNLGKGAAIKTALVHATGDVVAIQDADFEYDPADLVRLVNQLRRDNLPVLYGSRYLAPTKPLPWTKFRVAVCLINGLVRVLHGQKLTDEATCYKVFQTSLLRQLDVQARRFDFCPEVTAKLCRRKMKIIEVPITYNPRTHQGGKKIGWRDAVMTFWTLIKWRLKKVDQSTPAIPYKPKSVILR